MSLDVADVSLSFGATRALDHVDLAVETGEVVALLGPSGCGKSTLLRVITGLETPDTGEVTWDGESLAGVPVHERDIGLMFQDHALFAHRDVGANVAFGLRMKRDPNPGPRVAELLELVGLGGYENRRVESLSGGEAQRVALARALAPSPRLLLLDEPLGSLDRSLRERLVDDLSTVLRELGVTAVHVTHDQSEAFAVADRVAVMNEGRIERIGTPVEVWRDPQSAFVAGFVGHETIVERDGRPYVVRIDACSFGDTGEEAVVTHVRFVGDRFEVKATADDSTTYVVRTTEDPPPPGARVRITVDPQGVVPLSR